MKIYFAGEGYEDIQGVNKSNVLISYFYLKSKNKRIDLKKKYGWNSLFIDSGAFSAWSLKGFVNIDQYINYIKEGYADYYAVLDKIGDAEGTLQNQKYMESKGVKPLPCFHYGDDWKYLKYYCENYDYVCLGGMVPVENNELQKWLDIIFTNYPKQKFHGFGLTVTSLIRRYPWHSVDSSTWIVHMKFNELNHYELGRLYLGIDKKDFLKIINDPVNFRWRQACERYGIDITQLFEGYRLRTDFNLKAFQELENDINKNPAKPIFMQKQLEPGFTNLKYHFAPNKKDKSAQLTLLNSNLNAVDPIEKETVDKEVFYCNSCNREFEKTNNGRCDLCNNQNIEIKIKKVKIC